MATTHVHTRDAVLEERLLTARRLLADDKGSEAMKSVWEAESESAADQAEADLAPPAPR